MKIMSGGQNKQHRNPRGHHYVPQFYLSQFSRRLKKKRKLTVFPKGGGKPFETTPLNICKQRDFNRIEIDGEDQYELETRLSRFESLAANAFNRFVKHPDTDTDDFRTVINVVGLVAVRNPRFRATMADFMGDVMKASARLMVRSENNWAEINRKMEQTGYGPTNISYQEMRDFVIGGAYDVRFKREYFIAQELKALVPVIELLGKRQWTVVTADAHSGEFVTSDHPTCLAWQNPGGGMYGPGFGVPGTDVLFPVSTKVAIIGRFEPINKHIVASQELIAGINGMTIAYADQYVITSGNGFHYIDENNKLRDARHLMRGAGRV